MIKLFIIYIIITFVLLKTNGYLQGIKVEGRILCKKVPVSDLEIILKNENLLFDNILSKGKTNKDGYFVLSGKDNELSRIVPYVQITWTCPKEYILSHYDSMKFYVLENATVYYYDYFKYYYNFGVIDLYNVVDDLYQFPKTYV
ncbi:Transthyretin-like family-containing protein [Strongyloides ratti]|uniref:Transthyretin-like family-containing protein n=1 Tax=Strongyloides ratti TaxID=34506 RepID=A0A090LLL1_STRRB|nr:Transthyretin-like family-containing protein [Strongyloides ratti]CEF68440.1 Transthyretin-like family-containing protein [Strongyloides ratti]